MRPLVLALCLLIGLSACGGKDVSTGPSRNTACFINAVAPGLANGPWAFIVDIPSAHQHFELAETERKVVELVADDGSTEFEFTVTKKGTGDTTIGVVSVGQEVEITPSDKLEGYRVYVDGEEALG